MNFKERKESSVNVISIWLTINTSLVLSPATTAPFKSYASNFCQNNREIIQVNPWSYLHLLEEINKWFSTIVAAASIPKDKFHLISNKILNSQSCLGTAAILQEQQTNDGYLQSMGWLCSVLNRFINMYPTCV